VDPSEAQLIEREVDAVYGLATGPGMYPILVDPDVRVVFAWSPHARLLAMNAELRLDESPVDLDEPYVPGAVPRIVTALAAQLERVDTGGSAFVTGGPTFVIPPDVAAGAVSLPVVVSDDSGRARARSLDRPENWEADEWLDLTERRIGEWAMALHDDEPVSICHTPASNEDSAEAGVWTREDFRGQGLASAVVVAWAREERKNKQILFYSTWDDNAESQAVTRKLRLTPLGWMWIIK
jgi:GNAT superfamily N-acetyltransferase